MWGTGICGTPAGGQQRPMSWDWRPGQRTASPAPWFAASAPPFGTPRPAVERPFLRTRIERKGFSQTLSEKPERRSKSPPFRAALQQHLYGCVFKQKQGRRRKACLSLRCMTCSKEKQRGGELCCRAGARNKTLVQRSAMCSKEKKESQRKARLSSHRRSRAVQAGAAQLLMGSGAGGGTAQQHDGWGRLLAGPFLYPVAASCCCAVSRRQVGMQAVFNKRRNVGGVRLPQRAVLQQAMAAASI